METAFETELTGERLMNASQVAKPVGVTYDG